MAIQIQGGMGFDPISRGTRPTHFRASTKGYHYTRSYQRHHDVSAKDDTLTSCDTGNARDHKAEVTYLQVVNIFFIE